MKAFIDRIFKAKKQKKILDEITHAEVIEKNKEILSKQIETSIKKHVEEIKEVVAEAVKVKVSKEVKEKVVYNKPGHYFPDCNCFKCVRWRNQSA